MVVVLPIAERENSHVAHMTGLSARRHFKVTAQMKLWFKLPSLRTGPLPWRDSISLTEGKRFLTLNLPRLAR